MLLNDVEQRTSKYLNKIIEADHNAPRRVIRPPHGSQRMKTAPASLNGFAVMRMIRRGHCVPTQPGAAVTRLVNQFFGLAS